MQRFARLLVGDLLSMIAPFLLGSHDEGPLFLLLLCLLLDIDLILTAARLLLLLHLGLFRSIANLRIITARVQVISNHVLGNGRIKLEFLVHGAHQREQIVVRLPINKTLADVEVFAVLADLVMNDAVHYVDSGPALRKQVRHMDSHEKRLVSAL